MALDELPPEEIASLLPALEGGLSAWPDALRVAPSSWWLRATEGSPLFSLVRSLSLEASVAESSFWKSLGAKVQRFSSLRCFSLCSNLWYKYDSEIKDERPADWARDLFASLSGLRSLAYVRLSRCGITSVHMQEIVQLDLSRLVSLDLSENLFHGRSVQLLLEKALPGLTSLNLSGNLLDGFDLFNQRARLSLPLLAQLCLDRAEEDKEKGLASLVASLQNCQALSSVSLASLQLDDRVLDSLLLYLDTKPLKKLSLQGNPILNLRALSESSFARSIESLDISKTMLCSDWWLLKDFTSLRELHCGGVFQKGFGERVSVFPERRRPYELEPDWDDQILAQAAREWREESFQYSPEAQKRLHQLLQDLLRLPRLAQLRSLSLAELGLKDEGVLQLSQGFFAGLQSLDLSENAISAGGLCSLFQSPNFPSLRELTLSRNPFGSNAAQAFTPHDLSLLGMLDSLNTQKKSEELWSGALLRQLKALRLSGTGLSPRDLAGLLASIAGGSLWALDLSHNDLRSEGVEALVSGPSPGPLHTLRLAGCGLTDDDLARLCEGPHFGQVRELDLTQNQFGADALVRLLSSAAFAHLSLVYLDEALLDSERGRLEEAAAQYGRALIFGLRRYPPEQEERARGLLGW